MPDSSADTSQVTLALDDHRWLDLLVESVVSDSRAALQDWGGRLRAAADALSSAAEGPANESGEAGLRASVLDLFARIETTAAILAGGETVEPDAWLQRWDERLAALPEQIELAAQWRQWLRAAGDDPRTVLWRQRERIAAIFVKPHAPDPASASPSAPHASRWIGRRLPLRAFAAGMAEPLLGCEWTVTAGRQVRLAADWMRELRRLTLNLRGLCLLQPEQPSDLDGDPLPSAAWDLVRQHAGRWCDAVRDLTESESQRLAAGFSARLPELLQRWPWTGTSLLPAAKVSAARLEHNRAEHLAARRRALAAPWKRLRGRHGNLRKDLRLASALIHHAGVVSAAAERTRGRLDETLHVTFGAISRAVKQTWDDMSGEASRSPETLRETMRAAGDRLLVEMRHRRMPAAMQSVMGAGFEALLQDYQQNVESLLGSLPPAETIYLETQGVGSQHTIPFRDLLHRSAYLPFRHEFQSAEAWAKQRQGELVRGVSELDDLLEVNISAGLELLRAETGQPSRAEAVETAVRGFSRLYSRVRELERKAGELASGGVDQFLELALRLEGELVALSDNQNLVRLRLEQYRGELRSRILQRVVSALKQTGSGGRWLVTQAPRLLIWGRGEMRRLTRLAGIVESDEDAELRLTAFLQDSERIVADLPFVYQQLFRITPLEDERFFTSRDREMAVISSQLASWKAGRVANCALSGEQGSGRTTLLNMAKRSLLRDEQVVEIEFTETILDPARLADRVGGALGWPGMTDFAALQTAVLADEKRRIVIVENLQHLFLRTIDGFETLERFLLFVSRTGERLFWILSCAWHTWRYLDRVLQIGGYVQRVIRLDSLTGDELRAIIGRRHNVSGFHRTFVPGAEDLRLRRLRRARGPEDLQRVAEELFFERLQIVAAGNVAVALMIYLRAITRVDGDTLRLTTDIFIDETALAGLSIEEKFTLAAIVLHSGLTTEEHAAVFRQDLQATLRVLVRLENRGILVRYGDDYRLRPTIHRPIHKTLREANVLH